LKRRPHNAKKYIFLIFLIWRKGKINILFFTQKSFVRQGGRSEWSACEVVFAVTAMTSRRRLVFFWSLASSSSSRVEL
jgi:hypothetical protein